MVDHTVGRVLDLFGIPQTLVSRWEGVEEELAALPQAKSAQKD
jgi:hypothetical protein